MYVQTLQGRPLMQPQGLQAPIIHEATACEKPPQQGRSEAKKHPKTGGFL